MFITVKFDIDEKQCDPDKLMAHFSEYLNDILDVGYGNDGDDLFIINSLETVPTLLDATLLSEV
jgi:hypothetical protein